MKRIYICLLFFFMVMPVSSVIAADEINLEEIYGEGLANVPPVLKLKFENENGTYWKDASYDVQAAFLASWQEDKQAAVKDEKALLKQEKALEKEKLALEKAELRQKKLSDREAAAKERKRLREEQNERDALRKLIEQQERDLERMAGERHSR